MHPLLLNRALRTLYGIGSRRRAHFTLNFNYISMLLVRPEALALRVRTCVDVDGLHTLV